MKRRESGIRNQKSTIRNRAVAYYVSAHGYGHGVRSTDIIRAFNQIHPDVPVVIVSDLPVPFLENRLRSNINSFRPGSLDVGMVQIDSIRVDLQATFQKLETLYSRKEELLKNEVSFIEANDIALVVADIPAIPLEAAAVAGLPRLAIGNFAWDWIYSAYVDEDPRWERMVDYFAEGYAQADLLLRLPFSEEMKAFPRVEDLPIVASSGRRRRPGIMSLTKAQADRKWVLISFTTLEWDDSALDKVESLVDYEFFTVEPLAWRRQNIHALNREQISFPDVLASVDGVVSKLGFGILSECIVNQKPLLYVDRADFIEYRVLEKAARKYLKSVHIPAAKFYTGDLGELLEGLWQCPEPLNFPEQGGAPVAARRINDFLTPPPGR